MEESSESKEHDRLVHELKKAIASGYVNFLFGAGVNGGAFPNMGNGFEETKNMLKLHDLEGKNIESEIKKLGNETQAKEILQTFVKEYNGYSIKNDNPSYDSLAKLIDSIHNLVDKAENRQTYMNRINIFTLNYDHIVEDILDSRGYFFHSVAANKSKDQPLLNVIGYDISKKDFIPTFSVMKLHGSVDIDGKINDADVILPEKDKGIKTFSRDFFKVLFKMKEELERPNSLLFIIGYSGSDEDVNSILKESQSNIIMYWLKYNDSDTGVELLKLNNLITIESKENDSTECLNNLFTEVNKI